MYTELPGYFSNCIDLLYKTSGAEITVVYYPNSSKAPFTHELPDIDLVDRSEVNSKQLIEQCLSFSPDIVYVAGWIDRDYKKIAGSLKNRGSTIICGVDNVWKGTLRQRMACIFSGLLIKPYYTHLWVAGLRQYQFASRLGYSSENILTGLYAADVDKFKAISRYPHQRKLVYVGRIEHEKGIKQLYEAFNSLSENERNGWTLEIIGNGTLKKMMKQSTTTQIHDFMQPQELIPFVADAGGFILPSLEEPWGVVVHEFAAAGKPLILSSAVNSGEKYLINGYNGFRFQKEDAASLKSTLIKYFSLDDLIIKEMGERSAELALLEQPKHWVAKFLSLMN